MIINGRTLASELLQRISTSRSLVVRAVTVAPSSATKAYLSVKATRAKEAGMTLEVVECSPESTTEEVITAVQKEGADAVIVQLPLPESFDTDAIVNAIPVEKDADVLSEKAYARFERGEEGALLPPVVSAIEEILTTVGFDVSGKRAVVVGEGKLVGKPTALWLQSRGASVQVVSRTRGDMSLLKDAELIVSGAGQAGLITPEHVTDGVVLIDAGTSESNGALAGDALPSCAEKASVFTPVPGGVGPLAVACLFKNAALLTGGHVKLAERK